MKLSSSTLLELSGHSSFPTRGILGQLHFLAQKYGQGLALGGIDRPWLSYVGLAELVERQSKELLLAGIGRGSVAIMCLPNGPEALTTFLSVASVSAVIPASPEEPEAVIYDLMDQLPISSVLYDEKHPGVFSKFPERAGLQRIPLRISSSDPAGVWEFSSLVHQAIPAEPTQVTDAAVLVRTAGSTDKPKVVAWSQNSVLCSAEKAADWMGLNEADRSLCVMPFSHLHSVVRSSLPGLLKGGSIVCAPGFDRNNILSWIEAYKPTYMTAVPGIYRTLLERLSKLDGKKWICSLRFLASGSDSIDAETVSALSAALGIPVREFYGLSEVSPMLAATPFGEVAQADCSVGKILLPWKVACLDENGAELQPGAEGELVVKGGMVNPVVSPPPDLKLQIGNWFRTGDIGSISQDGRLSIVGRVDNRINRGGKKIAPEAVESALKMFPGVKRAVVFPWPDQVLGQRVAAAIVADKELCSREIRGHVARVLPEFMAPERMVFVDEIPETRAGKISRSELASLLLSESEEAHSEEVSLPANETESQLAELYASMLEVEVGSVDLNRDFMELGGDSFQATMMLVEIEERFGALLTPAQFLENGSVSALAALLNRHAEEPVIEDSPRISMVKKGDSSCPIFMTHSISGYADYASSFARRLSDRQTLYALQWVKPIYDDPHVSLETYTAGFVDEISHRAGDRPFVLAGHSFGAQFAFELGQQLLSRGLEPALIVLIDDEADLYKRQFGVNNERPAISLISGQCRHMLKTYVPKPYPGALALVQAEVEMADALADPFLGWKDLALGACERCRVPGDHHSMVSESGVARWTAQFESIVVKAGKTLRELQAIDSGRTDQLQNRREQSWKEPLTVALVQAREAAKAGNLDLEIEKYRLALTLADLQPFWVFRNLADALWQKGERKESLEFYLRAIETEDCPVEGCRILCQRLREAGFEGRAEIVELAISRTPGQPNAKAALARFLYEEGRILEARQYLIQVIEQQPDHIVAKRTLCDIYEETGKFLEALDLINQLVTQPGAYGTLFVRRAILLQRLGKLSYRGALVEAIKRQESYVHANPIFIHDRLLLSYLYYLNEQSLESRASFEESLRLLPESSDGLLLLKRILRRRLLRQLDSPKLAQFILDLGARFSKSAWLYRLFLSTARNQIRALRLLA